MRTGALFVCMFLLYLGLSGQGNAQLLVLGAIGCGGLTLLLRRLELVDSESLPLRTAWRLVPYSAWMLIQIVRGNLDVTRRVWSPSLPISPRMIRVPHDINNAVCLTTFANSITLTPGTVTARVHAREIVVHALSEESAKELLEGEMHRRIRQVELRAAP